jgi:catechol 2,3-dioxygenase-like lactoylglutathione lyase family enzyme
MRDLHARTVFFAKDAQRSLTFYRETLGFSLDWSYDEDGRAFVFQVNVLGFQLIVNQTEDRTEKRAGHGRVFIGIENDQLEAFRQHIDDNGIQTEVVGWGEPTLAIRDLDGNEIFLWLPVKERATLEIGQGWP